MSNHDVEMEDAKKQAGDFEDNVQECENKALDGNTVGEGEKLPCTAVVSDGANKTENNGKAVNEPRNEDEIKDKDKDKAEAKEQANNKVEGNEPIEELIQEQSDTVGENEKRITTITKDEERLAPKSAVEGNVNIKDEVFRQSINCVGETEEKCADNGLDGGKHLKISKEKSNEDAVEKGAKELAKGDSGDVENVRGDNNNMISEGVADYVEKVAGDNKTTSEGNADYVENVAGDTDKKTVSQEDADVVQNAVGDNKTIPEGNVVDVENDAGDKEAIKTEDTGVDPSQNRQLPAELSTNEAAQTQNTEMAEVPQVGDEEMKDSTNLDGENTIENDMKEQGGETVLSNPETNENAKTVETVPKHDEDSSYGNQQEPSTPNSLIRDSLAMTGDHGGGTVKSVFSPTALPLLGENDDGTPEEQAAFMKEIENFYRQRAMDFKPPKFYGQPLNCLKLWRAVIRLGGYDRVTGSKLWRQVGESFHPPKTCTTVSWTFRIFYEKSLLEYERHKILSGDLQLPAAAFPEASGVDVEANGYQGSGRARRDAAARAMQGWHAQRLSDYGEVGEPIIKDKNTNNVPKREKIFKSIGSLKQKRPNEAEHSNKAARTDTSRQLVTSVVDIAAPADWVKINVRQTKDCFEIYALVPGLFREEVRVQTDPAGRVVITGQPEQVDNPWGITPFKKVVNLPSRIDPLQTSAVVSLHGRLFIRVPFEQQQPNV